MSPKRGIKLDQILEFPDQIGLIGLKMLATGGTEFFGTTRYGSTWVTAQIRSTASASNGKLETWPIPVPEAITVDALRINVQTAADTNDDVRLGIYVGDGEGGRPSTLLATTADVPVDATGLQTATFTAVLLSPGLYWFAILGSNLDGSTNPLFRGASADVNQPESYYANHAIASNSFEHHAWGFSGQGATLPDPLPSNGAWEGGNNLPGLIYIQARVA